MLKICLILAIVSLTACQQSIPFPKVSRWIIDVDNGFCIKCELVDAEKQTYKCIDVKTEKPEPLSKCNGYFAESPEDYLLIKNWILDMTDKVKKRCGN